MASSVVSLWMTNGVFIKQGNDIYFEVGFLYTGHRRVGGRQHTDRLFGVFKYTTDSKEVELIELKDDFARVKFIHSWKGKRPEFWLERFDLEYRGTMECFLLSLVMVIPFSIYNIGFWFKGKFG